MMQVERMKVAPDTLAYADGEHDKLILEFAIPRSANGDHRCKDAGR